MKSQWSVVTAYGYGKDQVLRSAELEIIDGAACRLRFNQDNHIPSSESDEEFYCMLYDGHVRLEHGDSGGRFWLYLFAINFKSSYYSS